MCLISETSTVTPDFLAFFGKSLSLPYYMAGIENNSVWEHFGVNVLKIIYSYR